MGKFKTTNSFFKERKMVFQKIIPLPKKSYSNSIINDFSSLKECRLQF